MTYAKSCRVTASDSSDPLVFAPQSGDKAPRAMRACEQFGPSGFLWVRSPFWGGRLAGAGRDGEGCGQRPAHPAAARRRPCSVARGARAGGNDPDVPADHAYSAAPVGGREGL
eukprot:scaffold21254_cov49-Phaeocystis_antarctica.AAC.1